MLYCYRAKLTITKFSYAHPIQQLQVKKKGQKDQRVSDSTTRQPPYWLSAGGPLLRLQHNRCILTRTKNQTTREPPVKPQKIEDSLGNCLSAIQLIEEKKGVKAGILYAARML